MNLDLAGKPISVTARAADLAAIGVEGPL